METPTLAEGLDVHQTGVVIARFLEITYTDQPVRDLLPVPVDYDITIPTTDSWQLIPQLDGTHTAIRTDSILSLRIAEST